MFRVLDPVFLNGDYTPASDARISPFDRGFIYGDGVYEVVPIYDNRFFHLPLNLARLKKSLTSANIPNPHTPDAWCALFDELKARAGCTADKRYALYLQITRGTQAARGLNYAEDTPPTVFAYVAEVASKATPVAAHTREDIRAHRCDIKATSLMPAVLLKNSVAATDEVVMVRHGLLTEATSSNVFIVKDDTIYTPRFDHWLLKGNTALVLMDLLAANDMPVQQTDIPTDMLAAATEIWLTGSIKELLPLASLNGRALHTSREGSVFTKVQALWRAHMAGAWYENAPKPR